MPDVYPGKMKNKKTQYIILAFGVGLLILLPWLFKSPVTPDNQSLFTSNFTMPEASVSRGGEVEGLWERGNTYYANKEYSLAINDFESVLNDSSFYRKPQVQILLGACYIALSETEKGAEILGNVDENSFEFDRATWYRGLAFLHMNKVDSAKAHFENLTLDEKGEYHKQASKLLKQLK